MEYALMTKEDLLLELHKSETESLQLKAELLDMQIRLDLKNGQIMELSQKLRSAESQMHILEEKRIQGTQEHNKAEILGKSGNWQLLPDTQMMIISEGTRLIYGLNKNEELLQNFIQQTLPEYRTELDHALYNLMHQGKNFEMEYKIKRLSDGNIIDIHAIVEFDADQKVVFGTIHDITERKQAEEALRIMVTKYKVLFEILPIGITISDSHGKIVESNQIAESILGISREEQEKTKIDGPEWRIIRTDGTNMPAAEFASVRAMTENCQVMNVEMGIVKNNDQCTWLNVSATPVPVEGYGVVIVYNDTTDHKQIENENIRIQKLLEDSQKIGKIGGWEINLNTQELKWTKEMYHIHEVDYSFQPIMDQRINFYTPDNLSDIDSVLEHAKNHGTSYEISSQIITAKGNVKSVKSIGNVDIQNHRIVGFLQDISDYQIAVDALKKSEEKYRFLTENISDVIWIFNISLGRYTYISPSVFQLRGYTVEEAIEQSVDQSLTPESAEKAKIAASSRMKFFLESGISENHRDELRQPCKDGSIIWIETLTKYQYARDGGIEIMGVSRNITERKNAELKIKEQNNELLKLNADKDRFMSILAHDLKTPFNSLLGFSELLLDNIQSYDLPKIEKLLQTINHSAQAVYILLDDLLMWARSQSGRLKFAPQPYLVNKILSELMPVLTPHAESKQLDFRLHIPDDLVIYADKDMIKTVLRNLISNAVKYSHPEGFIDLTAVKVPQGVRMSVKDQGTGIQADLIGQLFDLAQFQTTSGTAGEKGTGLGLHLCKEFVEKHKGKIWVESTSDKGSEFSVFLPDQAF